MQGRETWRTLFGALLFRFIEGVENVRQGYPRIPLNVGILMASTLLI